MSRYVYTVESAGEETGLDSVHATASSAIHRLRKHYGNPIPHGAIKRLKSGETVWSEYENGDLAACARKMQVW